MMLTLKLYPAEFKGMLYHLERAVYDQQRVPITHQNVGTLVLLEYYRSWHPERVASWLLRNHKKQFCFRLKLSVARSLHLSLQARVLKVHLEQSFLHRLDEALTGYLNPVQLADARRQAHGRSDTNLLY